LFKKPTNQWDEHAKSISVHSSFEHDDVHQDLLHWEVKFPWPLSNRDYVFVRHRSVLDDGSHIMVSKGFLDLNCASFACLHGGFCRIKPSRAGRAERCGSSRLVEKSHADCEAQ
jgi:hypothetical protein